MVTFTFFLHSQIRTILLFRCSIVFTFQLTHTTLYNNQQDKILASYSTGNILVTNDGATILKSIALDNAAAKILVNISKVQDDEVGDGTTSVCVLASELLREAERLIDQKLHPQTIVEGYRIASAAALKALEASAVDNSANMDSFREDLMNIARTTLSSKVLSQDKEYFAKLAVDAVLRLKGSTNLDNINIIKISGGKLVDSYLDEGFILAKRIGVNQPKRIENAKILIANTREWNLFLLIFIYSMTLLTPLLRISLIESPF